MELSIVFGQFRLKFRKKVEANKKIIQLALLEYVTFSRPRPLSDEISPVFVSRISGLTIRAFRSPFLNINCGICCY